MEVTTSILYERRLLSLLRKGSRSRRLWESPPYTVGKVRASTVFMSFSVHVSISDFFTIRQKRIRGWDAFSEGNSASLKQRRLEL